MSPEQEKLLTEVELAKLWGVTTSFLQKMRHEVRGPRRFGQFESREVNAWHEKEMAFTSEGRPGAST